MKIRIVLAFGLTLLVALPALAQGAGEQRQQNQSQSQSQGRGKGNERQAPSPPRARGSQDGSPQFEHHPDGRVDRTPHYNNGRWYGNDRPDDPRYRLQRPFNQGRFPHAGPAWRYNVVRIDPSLRRFWLPGGFFFQIATWDWPYCTNWCWNCGNNFVVYDDPDHPGWYLLYNLLTCMYVHVIYMGY